MSAPMNNNNKEQKESEVEAAIGREVRLPSTGTRDLETAQSEGDVVATQKPTTGARRSAYNDR